MKFCLKPVWVGIISMAIFSSLQAQKSPVSKSNFIYRIKEINDSSGHLNYRHIFTYDDFGRPLSHTLDYFQKGKLYSSGLFKYEYDASGKLIAQNSDKLQYNYFYNNNTLNKITLKIFYKNKWELCEETLMDEIQSGNKKIMHFQMNKRKPVNGEFDSLKNYCDIEYSMDSSNNVLVSKVNAYEYAKLKEPIIYTYDYDNRPNPLQNIFVERWYQFDVENGGLTNVSHIKRGNDPYSTNKLYEYNEAGYPIKCTTNNYKFKTFKYETVEVPIQKTMQPQNYSFKSSMLIYPNPASVNFTIKASGLEKGTVILRIYDFSSGRALKQITYTVDDKLEALITTNGIPAGAYIVELINKNSILKEKLIVR